MFAMSRVRNQKALPLASSTARSLSTVVEPCCGAAYVKGQLSPPESPHLEWGVAKLDEGVLVQQDPAQAWLVPTSSQSRYLEGLGF